MTKKRIFPPVTQSHQCISCKHYNLGGSCDAFPEGIPLEIITGGFDHHNSYPGDHGIQYLHDL
jgi:hypothetical protein